jgi:hypothetical protein
MKTRQGYQGLEIIDAFRTVHVPNEVNQYSFQ